MEVQKFLQSVRKGWAVWEDEFGAYRVALQSGLVKEYLREYTFITISGPVEDIISIPKSRTHNKGTLTAISIGTFEAHNNAKVACSHNKCTSLITAPVPLTNDAFCTNRCSTGPSSSSFECVYPSSTLIDLELLKKFQPLNLLGVGEFIGLYFSLFDYYLVRSLCPPAGLVSMVIKQCDDIFKGYSIQDIALALILKCLIMRIHRDHEVGCGIDHLLAYVLQSEFSFPHGKAVWWASVISGVLLDTVLSLDFLDRILDQGFATGVINLSEAEQIYNLDWVSLIKAAIMTRPKRKTLLWHFSDSELYHAQRKFRRLLWER